jgi:endoglucanase
VSADRVARALATVTTLLPVALLGCGSGDGGGRTGSGGGPVGAGASTGSGGLTSTGGRGGSGAGTGGSAGMAAGSGGTVGATGGRGGSAGVRAGTGGSGGGMGGATAIAIPRAGRCSPPATARIADAQAAYAKWKADLLTTAGAGGFLRVRRPNSAGAEVNSTVSEGIAYGMLAAVYMDDQTTFDQLWRYSQLWLDGNGLMNWYINAAGTMALGTGGATDGDEDIAFALLLADKRWGGMGSLTQTYLSLGIRQVNLIWQFEVDHTRGDVLTPGDSFNGGAIINVSYFAPAFYRAFGRAAGQTANWNRVVESTYTVIAQTLNTTNGNATNGLVPAWSTPAGVPQAPAGLPLHHQLDSCRTPFRLAQDYCWYNEPRALSYLEKINSFHSVVGATNIVDGYDLNGTPHPQFAAIGNQSAAFVGPAGVGAMATPAYTTLRDQAYVAVATLGLLAGSQYYNESWTVLSLIMMTGLMDDLTLP